MNVDNLITFKYFKKVLMDGPLSRIFTQILHDEYEKEIDKDTGMVLESQVMQMIQKAQSYIDASKNNSEFTNQKVGMLYSVDSNDTIAQDLSNIATAYSVMDNNQIRNSAVLITNATEDIRQTNLNEAIEAFCTYANIPIYYTIESLVAAHKAV